MSFFRLNHDCFMKILIRHISIPPEQVHTCWTIVLFFPRGLRPPTGRRKRGLVWLPSVSSTSHVEDDAQY